MFQYIDFNLAQKCRLSGFRIYLPIFAIVRQFAQILHEAVTGFIVMLTVLFFTSFVCAAVGVALLLLYGFRKTRASAPPEGSPSNTDPYAALPPKAYAGLLLALFAMGGFMLSLAQIII